MQIQWNLHEAPTLRVTSSCSLQVRSVRFWKCAPREEESLQRRRRSGGGGGGWRGEVGGLGACSPRNFFFFNLGSRNAISSVFCRTFSVNWYEQNAVVSCLLLVGKVQCLQSDVAPPMKKQRSDMTSERVARRWRNEVEWSLLAYWAWR